MSKYVIGGVIGVVWAMSMVTEARAQALEEPPDANAEEPPKTRAGDPPKARVGFQMMIRTGYSLPMGNVSGNASTPDTSDHFAMSDLVTGQVPFLFDIGGKVIPEIFLGGYTGFAFGGAAGRAADACDASNASCIGIGFRLGAELQYHILPSEAVNPWVGYGIGLEATGVSASSGDEDETVSVSGFEFARFMAGVDFRLSRGVGVGPFVDLTMGSYSTLTQSVEGRSTSLDVAESALHEWLTLGVRLVIFP